MNEIIACVLLLLFTGGVVAGSVQHLRREDARTLRARANDIIALRADRENTRILEGEDLLAVYGSYPPADEFWPNACRSCRRWKGENESYCDECLEKQKVHTVSRTPSRISPITLPAPFVDADTNSVSIYDTMASLVKMIKDDPGAQFYPGAQF